jgi:DNA topoisomerase-3
VERKGLGTPATRANIIETLVFREYIERKGKNLISTDKGKTLIDIVPDILKSAKMTADWENRLALIAKGKADNKTFITDIENLVHNLITE